MRPLNYDLVSNPGVHVIRMNGEHLHVLDTATATWQLRIAQLSLPYSATAYELYPVA